MGVHLDDYTCECESGFEFKSITKNGTTYHTCENIEDCPDAEFSHDCNRMSCGVPVFIDNADHEPSSSVKFNETVTYEGHSGDSLDGEPDVNRSFTTNLWCCSKWIHGSLFHSRHQRSEDHL